MRGEVVPQRIAAVDPVAMGVATEWEEAAAVLEAGMEEAQKRAEELRASMENSEAHKDFAKAEVARVAALAVDGARRLADPELRDKLENAARRAALAARAGPRGDLRIPAGGKLLDMYDPEFWPSIFYDLFTFGDNVPWLDREAKFPYDDWAAHIQWREEPEYGGAADACEPWAACAAMSRRRRGGRRMITGHLLAPRPGGAWISSSSRSCAVCKCVRRRRTRSVRTLSGRALGSLGAR